MFDIGATELLVIAIVAILVIGPKDLPLALRTAGRWIGKIRRVSSHFRTGLDAMIREAEMDELDRRWRERNEAIMAEHPPGSEMEPIAPSDSSPEGPAPSAAEARAAHGKGKAKRDAASPEPGSDGPGEP